MRTLTLDQARAGQYCVTSWRHLRVARLDRPDWQAVLADAEPGGVAAVDALGPRRAADIYRRVYSKDVALIPRELIALLPRSDDGPVHFYELAEA